MQLGGLHHRSINYTCTCLGVWNLVRVLVRLLNVACLSCTEQGSNNCLHCKQMPCYLNHRVFTQSDKKYKYRSDNEYGWSSCDPPPLMPHSALNAFTVPPRYLRHDLAVDFEPPPLVPQQCPLIPLPCPWGVSVMTWSWTSSASRDNFLVSSGGDLVLTHEFFIVY